MFYFVYKPIGLRELKPTKYLLQFANGSIESAKNSRRGRDSQTWQILILDGFHGDQYKWGGDANTGDPMDTIFSNKWSID